MGKWVVPSLLIFLILYGIAARAVHPRGITSAEASMLDWRDSVFNAVTERLMYLHAMSENLTTTSECRTLLCFLTDDPSYAVNKFVYTGSEIFLQELRTHTLEIFDTFCFLPVRLVYRAFLDIMWAVQ